MKSSSRDIIIWTVIIAVVTAGLLAVINKSGLLKSGVSVDLSKSKADEGDEMSKERKNCHAGCIADYTVCTIIEDNPVSECTGLLDACAKACNQDNPDE